MAGENEEELVEHDWWCTRSSGELLSWVINGVSMNGMLASRRKSGADSSQDREALWR